MKTRIIVIASLACMWTSFALAVGGISSGGGASVVCRDINKQIISAELLDLFEGSVRFGFDIQYSHEDPRTQLINAIDNLHDNFKKVLVTEVASDILKHFVFLPVNVALAASNDLGDEYGVVVKEGCALEGVGFYEDDGTLKVSRSVYNAFSETDKAAFILHEAIYKIARDTSGHKTSAPSRKLNALLFSGPTFTPDDVVMQNMLESEIFYYPDLMDGMIPQFIVLPQTVTDFNIITTPTSNEKYDLYVTCQYHPQHWTRGEFHGTGATTITMSDIHSCYHLSLNLPHNKNFPLIYDVNIDGVSYLLGNITGVDPYEHQEIYIAHSGITIPLIP